MSKQFSLYSFTFKEIKLFDLQIVDLLYDK